MHAWLLAREEKSQAHIYAPKVHFTAPRPRDSRFVWQHYYAVAGRRQLRRRQKAKLAPQDIAIFNVTSFAAAGTSAA
jgi:hypothetical protein